MIHLAQQNFPVSSCRHILLIESFHGFEAFPHESDIQCMLHMLTTARVSLRELLAGTTCLVQIKSLAKESLPHLVTDSLRSVRLVVYGFVCFGPLVEVLLQVALFHDFCAPVERGSTRPVHFFLFDFNLLA